MNKIKITHIITGLETGGAEMMLYKYLQNMNNELFDADVISITDIGVIGKKIAAMNIPVRALKARRGMPNPLIIVKLALILKKVKPDLIQTWMYHANLIGGLAAKLTKNIPVVWGIHHSNLDPTKNKRSTILTARFCGVLSSRVPSIIVCCSHASFSVHRDIGYDEDKMVVIENGFDLDVFKPDRQARDSLCKELRISKKHILIGLVGRFDPQKDHNNFILAAKILLSKVQNVHFVLCGDGITWNNKELSNWIRSENISEYFHLLGRREDIPRISAALDILSTSSCGEGFPNVIGEAMSSGVPCVVTDVGDSALIVGPYGVVVPPKNPEALSDGWQKIISMSSNERKKLGLEGRKQIEKKFSIRVISSKYESIYNTVINKNIPDNNYYTTDISEI